jgi:arginine decarboxylase
MSTSAPHIDQFLKIHSGRADSWRDLTHLAESWARGAAIRGAAETALAALAPTEAFHAYPGRD